MWSLSITVRYPVHDGEEFRDDSVPRHHIGPFSRYLRERLVAAVRNSELVLLAVSSAAAEIEVVPLPPERSSLEPTQYITDEDSRRFEEVEQLVRRILADAIRSAEWR